MKNPKKQLQIGSRRLLRVLVLIMASLYLITLSCRDPRSVLQFQSDGNLDKSITIELNQYPDVSLTFTGNTTLLLSADSTLMVGVVNLFVRLKSSDRSKDLTDFRLNPKAISVWFEDLEMSDHWADEWAPEKIDPSKERWCSFRFECDPRKAQYRWDDSIHVAPANITIIPWSFIETGDSVIPIDTIVAYARELSDYSGFLPRKDL